MVRRARTTKGGSISSWIRVGATLLREWILSAGHMANSVTLETFEQRMDGSLRVGLDVSVRYRTNTYKIP